MDVIITGTSKGSFAFVNECISTSDLSIVLYRDWFLNSNDYCPTSEPSIRSIIGFVKNLTESQWSEIVDLYKSHSSKGHTNYIEGYHDYTNNSIFPDKADLCKTATESGKSLMKSLGILESEKYYLVKL